MKFRGVLILARKKIVFASESKNLKGRQCVLKVTIPESCVK